MIDPDILRGAIKRAAGNELGLDEDQVMAIEIERLRERAYEGAGGESDTERPTRERRSPRAIRPADRKAAANFNESKAEVPRILKEFDVENIAQNIEYGNDQSDFILTTADDEIRKSRDERRKDTAMLDQQYEEEARRGIFGIDVEEEPRDKEPYRPKRNAFPEEDDFVVKRKGGIPIGFVRDKDGLFRKPSRDPDAKVKAVMAKRRGGQEVERYDPKYNGGKGGFVKSVPEWKDREQFYPGAANVGPSRDSVLDGRSTRSNDLDIYNRLTTALNTGQITDPVQIQEAENLKRVIKLRIDPSYAKAAQFDEGVRTVRENSDALPAEEIRRRANLELRIDEDIQQSGASEGGVPWRRATSVTPTSDYAAREAAILESLNKISPAAFGTRDTRASVEGVFLPSEVNFDGMGTEEIKLDGFIGGKKDYTRTVPRMLREEMENMPLAYFDPTLGDGGRGAYLNVEGGDPLARQNVSLAPSAANTPDASQTVNAPRRSSLMDVMQDNWYNSRQSGQYPQANISQEISTLQSRLQGLGSLAPEGSLGIRSLAEAEALLNQVIAKGKAKGTKFTEFGSKKVVSNPDALEALTKMRYTSPEIAALSNALIQMKLADKMNVNLDRKESYNSRTGSYMPQDTVGQAVVDLGGAAGSVIPGKDYIQFDRPDAMGDYRVGENISFANQRNAPQFRKLTGKTLNDLPAAERAQALDDARRPYVGAENGVSVPIEGKFGNPNYRFNKTGITEPADIAIHLEAQAQRRADRNGKPVDTQALQNNITNNVAVTRRHQAGLATPSSISDEAGARSFQQRQEVLEHIQRPLSQARPHYRASDKQLERKFYDKGRTTEELLGVNAFGIPSPKGRQEPATPDYKVVDSPINIELPENYVPKSERQGKMGRIKESLGNAFNKYGKDDQYKVGRRVGYGGAAVLGAAGLAGLINGERDKRQEAQY